MKVLSHLILIGLISGSLACSVGPQAVDRRAPVSVGQQSQSAAAALLDMQSSSSIPMALQDWCGGLNPFSVDEEIERSAGHPAIAGYVELHSSYINELALQKQVENLALADPNFLADAIDTCGGSLQRYAELQQFLLDIQNQFERNSAMNLTATAIEYALLIALIAVVCIASIRELGGKVAERLRETAEAMGESADESYRGPIGR